MNYKEIGILVGAIIVAFTVLTSLCRCTRVAPMKEPEPRIFPGEPSRPPLVPR